MSTFLTQNIKAQVNRQGHDERSDAVYIEVDKNAMGRSPAYKVSTPNYFTVQVNIDENGNNIIGDAGNEPSLAVDPTNPNRIVMGWRQFDDANNYFRQAGYAYSLDGGYNWVNPGVLRPGIFGSDPVLDFDANGNFYYNSFRAQEDWTCEVSSITDGGVNWNPPVYAFGGDKTWMRIDKSNTGDNNNYSFWSSFGSNCEPHHFTRSTDGSQSFEDCTSVLEYPYLGTMAVDSNGNLYLSGTTDYNTSNAKIIVVKSTTANNPNNPVSWDFSTEVNLDGYIVLHSPCNPDGLMGQVWVDVDVSGSSGDGNVYVLASLSRETNTDPADVMFAKSIDGGETFSFPTRINTDQSITNYQWFGTMSVAPNGRIDVVWLDTRDAPTGTVYSVLYYSFSEDHGETWSENEPISLEFDQSLDYPAQNKLGDYFDMVSDNDYAHLAWANTLNGGHDVYYTRISPYGILGDEDISEINPSDIVIYPNPANDQINISGSISQLSVVIYDVLGKEVLSMKATNTIDVSSLRNGVYIVKLIEGNRNTFQKLVKN